MKISIQIRNFKSKLIRMALEHNHGNIRATARSLGTSPSLMQRWITILELDGFARDLRRNHTWWLARLDTSMVALVFTLFLSTTLSAQFSWPTYPVHAPTAIFKVMVDNGSGVAILATSDAVNFIGITQNSTVAPTGTVALVTGGPSQVLIGATPVVLGGFVTSDANGNVIPFAPVTAGKHCYLGTVIAGSTAAGHYTYVNVRPVCSTFAGSGGGGVSSFNGATGAIVITGLVSGFADNETPTGSGTTYTLAHAPNPPASLQLFEFGIGAVSSWSLLRQVPTLVLPTDYTLSGSTISTFASTSAAGLMAFYRY
jgi:hypothetical protein